MSNQIAKIERSIKVFTIAAWSFVIIGFLAGAWGWYVLHKDNGGLSLNNLSSFGSYLQGAVASLWSLSSFLFIYVAFLGQKQQLFQQNEELEHQSKQFEMQYESIQKQTFENSFFQLLNLHNQIITSMAITTEVEEFDPDGQSMTHNGRKVFEFILASLRNRYSWSRPSDYNANDVEYVISQYEPIYKKYQAELGHYFRNLYHIVKFVNDSNLKDKKRYFDLIMAQLSQNEIALLFYNGISSHGVKRFKPMIEAHGLLQNFDRGLLLAACHERFYDMKAFA